jgi:hypothetical protein
MYLAKEAIKQAKSSSLPLEHLNVVFFPLRIFTILR